ncbi:M23 family metallopeptidase [Peribacillus kribbensis]|uniref:M23 family metallopeptidase n=1 Tax=Peribacillus kribbensis TaxID=356658 RepID=UPI0004022545|nr:M23 family metallopeptidase [Peribacillus kribbensis]
MREEEKKRTSQNSKIQRIIKKRWALPAIYIICAAVILTGALWYQNAAKNSASPENKQSVELGKNQKQPAVEANRSIENFSMPVKDPDQVVVKKDFYDPKASKEEQESSLVVYNNTYEQNKGMDFAKKDGKGFNVLASLDGKVTKVEEDSTLGNLVEIEHSKGIVTRYTSLQDIKVEVGDKVTKGQAIAKAGQSLLNEKAGTHVHFEIRKDDVAVNPKSYFGKTLADLQDAKVTPEKSTEEKVTTTEDDKMVPESTPEKSQMKEKAKTDDSSSADTEEPAKDNTDTTNENN